MIVSGGGVSICNTIVCSFHAPVRIDTTRNTCISRLSTESHELPGLPETLHVSFLLSGTRGDFRY